MIKRIPSQKQTFIYLFLLLVLILMFLPLVVTFNDILTRLVMRLDAYKFIQDVIIPWEVRMVGVVLLPFGFKPAVVGEYLSINSGKPLLIEIAWNCIGWQSLLFFLMTGWVGFQGNRYTNMSKYKAWIVGLLGTFLINLLRITTVVLLTYYFGQGIALFFHDYFSNIILIIWLFFFWWFAYSYVLEEKETVLQEESGKV